MRKLDAYLLWSRDALRIARSFYVANGLSAALGLLLISGLVHLLFGPEAGSAASVGVLVTIPPDGPAPRRGKFFHLLPAALIGLPLFAAVHALHDRPLALGLLLVPATFFAFLGAAWGKRGLPISVSIMFAMVFSMAVPATTQALSLVQNSAFFAVGAGAYLVYATAANALLNMRYRAQMLAGKEDFIMAGNLLEEFNAADQDVPVVAVAAATRRQDSEGESTGGSSVRGVVGAGEEDAAQCQGRVAGSEVAAGPTAGNLAWPPLRGMGGAGGGGGGAWGGELMADDWI